MLRWTRQPPAFVIPDRSNWLAQRLSHAFIPGVTGRDLLGFGAPMVAGGTPPLPLTASAGRALGGSTGAEAFGHTTAGVPGSASYPLVQIALGYFTNAGGSWNLSAMARSGSAGGELCTIRLGSSTLVEYSFRVNFGSTISVLVNPGVPVSGGTLLCCVAQSLSATDHRLYVNGVQGSDVTNAGALAGTYDELIAFDGSAGRTGLEGGVLFDGFGFKPFTDQEALAISLNPGLLWQMFVLGTERVWSAAAAASGVPVLSAAGVTSIAATTATPQVTLTF